MNSERFAAILGTLIALAVLAAAVFYVPIGSVNKLVKPVDQQPAAPANPVAAAPAPRGPVIRDVPQ